MAKNIKIIIKNIKKHKKTNERRCPELKKYVRGMKFDVERINNNKTREFLIEVQWMQKKL